MAAAHFLICTIVLSLWALWAPGGLCVEEFELCLPDLDKHRSKCRLSGDPEQLECLKRAFDALEAEDSAAELKERGLLYQAWLLSLPELRPFSVIYNEVPLEADQSDLYRDNYLEEPKFAPSFYRIHFNDYYDHMRADIVEDVYSSWRKPWLARLKQRLAEALEVPRVVFEAKASLTTSFDEKFSVKLNGDSVDWSDTYARSALLFIDYFFFRRLSRLVRSLTLSKPCRAYYRLRLRFLCRLFWKRFRRFRRVLSKPTRLSELMNLSLYTNVGEPLEYPFTPLPPGPGRASLSLELTSPSHGFTELAGRVVFGLKKRKVDLVLSVLRQHVERVADGQDLGSLGELDSFYVLEVTPKSTGVSLYNLYPPEERRKLYGDDDKFLVASHVERLDAKHPVFQIGWKLAASTPLALLLAALLLRYLKTM